MQPIERFDLMSAIHCFVEIITFELIQLAQRPDIPRVMIYMRNNKRADRLAGTFALYF